MADDQVNPTAGDSIPALVNTPAGDVPQAQASPSPPSQVPPQTSEEEFESDEESDFSEEEENHSVPHLTHAQVHNITPSLDEQIGHYVQRFGIHALLFLQYTWAFLSYIANTTQTITKGVMRSMQPQVYVFFEHSNYPYRLQDINIQGAGVPPVEWYYDADKKVFLSPTFYNTQSEYTTHHLEWLCGSIRYNNLSLYDISDYLQQTRWAGRSKPSVARVLAAWSIHSGYVLNGMDGVTLQTINEDGTESTLPVRG